VSAEGEAKLVMMANQIAAFFAGQHVDAAGEVAGHFKAFWAPPMRDRIIAHLAKGRGDLSEVAAAGVARLRDESRAHEAK